MKKSFLPICFKYSLPLFITVLIFAGCITIVIPPMHTTSDLYERNMAQLKEKHPIVFIEITGDEVLKMNNPDIYLFSNWCSGVCYYLKHLTPETKGNVMYISGNYDIPFIVKNFKALDTVYILSNSAYGSIESEKILKFTSEITNTECTITGVPQKFVRNDSTGYYTRQMLN